MPYKISEIVNEIKDTLPQEASEQYRAVLSAKNSAALLEENGLLYKDGNGRRPTILGNHKGISEELRTNQSTGETYWQVLYNETAKLLVCDLIYSNYPELNPLYRGGYEIKEHPASQGHGRATAIRIGAEYGCKVILVNDGTVYRAYDGGAIELCRVLDTEPYYAASGHAGVQVKSEDLNTFAIPALKNAGIDFAVNNDKLTVYRKNAVTVVPPKPPVPLGRRAKIGDTVRTLTRLGEYLDFYLSEAEIYDIRTITHNDGTIEFMRVPVTERNGCKILSPESPLSIAIVGKCEGEMVVCNGAEYQIISIRKGLQ